MSSAPKIIMSAVISILMVWFANASAVAAGPPALQDQYGNSDSLSEYAGQAVLAIVASPRKLRWIGRWEETLRPELPNLVSIRIADVTDEPPPTYEKVAATLRKRVPKDVSILIDMQNYWATAYELDTREPCLVLFDSNHDVVQTFRGRSKGELVDEVVLALREYFPTADES